MLVQNVSSLGKLRKGFRVKDGLELGSKKASRCSSPLLLAARGGVPQWTVVQAGLCHVCFSSLLGKSERSIAQGKYTPKVKHQAAQADLPAV